MLERRATIQARSAKMPEVTDEAGLRSYIEVSCCLYKLVVHSMAS